MSVERAVTQVFADLCHPVQPNLAVVALGFLRLTSAARSRHGRWSLAALFRVLPTTGTLHAETRVRVRHLRRGRPRAGDPVREERQSWYRLEFATDEDGLRRQARADGVFPLVTNLPVRPYSTKEALPISKYQPYVEKRHALLKSQLEVAPVYLKRPQRVVGLVRAHFLTIVLEALIERTVRLAMRRERVEPLPILPEGRSTRTPTAPRILKRFTGVSWYEFERGDETTTSPIQLAALRRQLLHLLGIDPRVTDNLRWARPRIIDNRRRGQCGM